MNPFLIVWTDKALSHLDSIHYFISQDSKEAATKVVLILLNHVGFLINFPEAGRIEESNKKISYRFVVKGNYKIVYRVIEKEKIILISAVFDTRQNPKSLKKFI